MVTNGLRIKCLTMFDDFTCESLDIPLDPDVSGVYVVRLLDKLPVLGQSSRRTHRQLARVRQSHVYHLDAAAMGSSTPMPRGAAIAKAFEISEGASELIYGALGAAGMIREMKVGKLPRSCAFGLVFAIASFAASSGYRICPLPD